MVGKQTGTKSAPLRHTPPRTGEADRTPEIGVGIAALIYFAIAIIYFLPAFFPGRHIFGTDYTQNGYFMYEFAREQIAAGHLPKWVPYIFGGLPMFANPGSVYYPIRLLFNLALPGTWAQPGIYVFQFGMAGVGMYLLARELGCRTWVAVVAGLAFQLTGVTLSAVHAGHDGRIIVATFAPLFLFFLHRAVRTGSMSSFAGIAATLGLSLLSFQIQSNYYLLLAGIAWALFALVHLNIMRAPRALAVRTTLGIAAVVFGFALAAVNFLPFRDYVADSPRGEARGYEYSTTWSLPPVELLGVAVPEHTGSLGTYRGTNPFKLNTEYVGALVLVLFVMGIAYSRRNRHWWFFVGLLAVVLTIVVGGHTPIYRFFYEFLPGTKRFRAPSIAFFIVALALVTMAAITLERLAQMRTEKMRGGGKPRVNGATEPRVPRVLAGIVGGAIISAIVAAAVSTNGADSQTFAGAARFAAFTAVTCVLLWLWWEGTLRTAMFALLLSVTTLTDLVIVNRKFFSTVVGPETMFAVDSLIAFMRDIDKPARVWIMPAAGWEDNNVLMLYDVEQAGGQHGNQLQRFNEYAGTTGASYIDWSNVLQKSNFLNAANIRYVLTRANLNVAGQDTQLLKLVHSEGGFVYENLKALPRAYLVGTAVTTPDTMAALQQLGLDDFIIRDSAIVYSAEPIDLPREQLSGQVEFIEHSPDRVVLRARASRPAFLVLADNYHKDWIAQVNGTVTPILRTNHTFRGVRVGAGDNDVVFEFKPRGLYTGFYLYLAGFGLLAAYGLFLIVRQVRARKQAAA